MTDAYLEAESSIQNSLPREIFEITAGTTVYRIATADRDVLYGGNIYTASAVARGSVAIPNFTGQADFELLLPIDHPLVGRYFSKGIPPQKVTVVARRLQGDLAEMFWAGEVTSIACDDMTAKLLIPARAPETAQRMLPTVTLSKSTCVHQLYDSMCRIERVLGVTYFSTPVLLSSGRDIRVDLGVSVSDPERSDWAVRGEIVHVASGERMSIIAQADLDPGVSTLTKLTLQFPLAELKAGDTVEIHAGCDHTLETCVNKFSNRQNFGGLPQTPRDFMSLRFSKG